MSVAEIVSVTDVWGTAVIKPTDAMAGRRIMLLRSGDPNLRSIIDTATSRGRDQVVVQRFIEQASEGDRRVIVVDGEPYKESNGAAARRRVRHPRAGPLPLGAPPGAPGRTSLRLLISRVTGSRSGWVRRLRGTGRRPRRQTEGPRESRRGSSGR